MTSSESTLRTVKVSGLGHSITLELERTATIGSLKEQIAMQTKIPAVYQRLLARGKNLDTSEITMEEARIEHRTKIMLMHSALYVQEKEGYEMLTKLSQDIESLNAKKESFSANVLSESITRICCKLDAVDTKGSENLRAQRRELLRKAESIDSRNYEQ